MEFGGWNFHLHVKKKKTSSYFPLAVDRFLTPPGKLTEKQIEEGYEDEYEADRWVISRVRSLIERVIKRIKVWTIMREPFRSSIWMNHGPCAHAVVRILENIVFDDEPVVRKPIDELFMLPE